MAIINRYSDLSPSKFNPMSLQEIMAVPTYKQNQYDQTAAAQAMLQGALKPDPLKEHEDLALKTKQDFDNKVELQSALLAKTGNFTDAQGDVMKLKKQYDDLVSPTGTIGKINAAKAAEAASYKAFMESDSAKTNSDEVNQMNWQKFRSKYTGYADPDKKIISNIGSLSAVKNRTLEDELKDLKGILGEQVVQDLSAGNGSITTGADGMVYITNKSGHRIAISNSEGLQSGLAAIGTKLNDPNSDITKSILYRGEDPRSVMNRLGLAQTTMTKESLSDTRNQHLGVQDLYGVTKAKEDGGAGSIISTGAPMGSNATDIKTYSDAHNIVKNILTIPENQRTPAQQSQLDDTKELQDAADLKLNGGINPDTGEKVPANAAYQTLQKQFVAKQNEIKAYAKAHGLQIDETGSVITRRGDDRDSRQVRILEGQLGEIGNKRSAIKDAAWQQSSSMRHDYAYMPTTPKEKKIVDIHNENIQNVLTGTNNLQDQINLRSFTLGDGTKNKVVTSGDIGNVKELMKGASDFKINNIKTYGDDKTPEVTVSFTTHKNAKEYDSENSQWSDNYGGGEKPMTVTFKLKPLSNAAITKGAPGYDNLSGAIAKFYKDKGETNPMTNNQQGHEVYSALTNNTYRNFSNADLATMAARDEHAREALSNRAIKKGVNIQTLINQYGKNKL